MEREVDGSVNRPITRALAGFDPCRKPVGLRTLISVGSGTILPMTNRSPRPSPGRVTARIAKAGQAAWLFGNLYEGAVGVPHLLGWARAERPPGLLTTGSPVRYFAPIAPLALGTTTITLIRSWRSGQNRHLIAAAAGCFLGALGLSVYLIRTVNLPLLAKGDSVTAVERSRLAARWHRVNALRLLLLGAGLLVDPSH